MGTGFSVQTVQKHAETAINVLEVEFRSLVLDETLALGQGRDWVAECLGPRASYFDYDYYSRRGDWASRIRLLCSPGVHCDVGLLAT